MPQLAIALVQILLPERSPFPSYKTVLLDPTSDNCCQYDANKSLEKVAGLCNHH
ncbi:MAG: hypothetical protein KME06_19980 [Kastovskya adunca ATA6-11-RM4]|nr:hypothetical protein [Kastovskya adunca ATA6-11-RM4]